MAPSTRIWPNTLETEAKMAEKKPRYNIKSLVKGFIEYCFEIKRTINKVI